MNKTHLTITLDENLVKKAQEDGINLSGTLNTLLRKYQQKEPTEQEKQILNKIDEKAEQEKERHEHLMDLARRFWQSPWGKKAVNKSMGRDDAVEGVYNVPD